MALRVLLADESTTIKKVMELSLAEYNVQVQAVSIGLDVVQFAKKFQPHIIFADVLLPKKSGYDVCQEIKSDPDLNKTPVILMWSGFLELDKAKVNLSNADDRIEKPFDSKTLIDLIAQKINLDSFKSSSPHQSIENSNFKNKPQSPKPDSNEEWSMEKLTKSIPKSFDSNINASLSHNISNFSEIDFPSDLESSLVLEKSEVTSFPSTPETSQITDNIVELSSLQNPIDEFLSYPDSNTEELTSSHDLNTLNEQDIQDQKPSNVHKTQSNELNNDSKHNFQRPIANEFNIDDFKIQIPQQQQSIDIETSDELIPNEDDMKNSNEYTFKNNDLKPKDKLSLDSTQEIKEILIEYARDYLEEEIKKTIPYLAEKIIKQEIKRLLDET